MVNKFDQYYNAFKEFNALPLDRIWIREMLFSNGCFNPYCLTSKILKYARICK